MATSGEKLKKVGIATNLQHSIVLLILGIFLLVASFLNFNALGTVVSVILFLIGLFLIIFGVWGAKKMWKAV
ncbi:MAG: hypothetical protein KAS32_05230 [Candidatus Peribacteraceae bacterium]|nr:hypothetical protein [Candidatus Peribacteraceae bacterium]